ncbi:hypothetical protein [Castellaniella sp.]|uniref:hypothetical protein n=1 Tax=Castellaniella sp. TaxID=1955812 RepID=UPI002AFE434A|nr:hypothetical protein [Castellaniella sp.]
MRHLFAVDAPAMPATQQRPMPSTNAGQIADDHNCKPSNVPPRPPGAANWWTSWSESSY